MKWWPCPVIGLSLCLHVMLGQRVQLPALVLGILPPRIAGQSVALWTRVITLSVLSREQIERLALLSFNEAPPAVGVQQE